MRLGIIGGGRAAWAFGSAWRRGNLPLAGIALRDGSPSELPRLLDASVVPTARLVSDSDLLLLAVPDGAIAEVASGIPPHLLERTYRFHASGSLPCSILGGGPRAFSLHPLVALPPPGTPSALPALVVFEGPDESLAVAEAIAAALGAPMSRIEPASKPLYHAAAVLGSNHVAALLEIATGILHSTGLEEEESRRAISALARSAIDNWESAAPDEKFTGPVARAELATVALHLGALAGSPAIAELYRRLSMEVARVVEKRGRKKTEISEIIDFLRGRPVS